MLAIDPRLCILTDTISPTFSPLSPPPCNIHPPYIDYPISPPLANIEHGTSPRRTFNKRSPGYI